MLLIKVLLQVLYDDEEVETLNLRKEKWELLGDDEVRFLAIDDQTLFPFCFLKLENSPYHIILHNLYFMLSCCANVMI